MNILVACEESQAVCSAFRKNKHNAFSCDLMPCSGGHPEWHILGDCLPLLNGVCSFNTCDGVKHYISSRWDMIIAFPPCTNLCSSGARHFEIKRNNGTQADSIDFFMKFLFADCDKIAVENPIGIISGNYIPRWFPALAEKYCFPLKPSQIIQPYYFGDAHKKSTCLWLKGLPLLTPSNVVEPDLVTYVCKSGKIVTFDRLFSLSCSNRSCLRSKTFPGIANAMAVQWGGLSI